MSDTPFQAEPPAHMVGCAVNTKEAADLLAAELATVGFSGEDAVHVVHGQEALEYIDPDGVYHGRIAHLVRVFQKFTTGVEERFFNAIKEELTQGHYLVGVMTDGSDGQRHQVSQIMEGKGASHVFYSGKSVIQLISGW
ncbi:MAG: hypothetical protein AAF702_45540 [Chloroflexota bacterium]